MTSGGSDAPDLSRRERRKREVHDRIVAAAVALFDRQGPNATKVDAICERADVAQKTFFNHFPTKQHLLQQIARNFLEALLILLEEARKEDGATPQRLVHFFERVVEETERAGPMHRELVLEVIRVAHSEHSEPEQTRALRASFAALIRDGVEAGDVTREHDVEVVTEMVLGAFYTIMLNWVSLDDYRLRDHAAAVARFLAHAIAVPA